MKLNIMKNKDNKCNKNKEILINNKINNKFKDNNFKMNN